MNTILKIYIVVILYLLNFNYLCSQSILFEDDTLSFGVIDENHYNKTFYFKNISNKPIIINSIIENCPCIVVNYNREPIYPNKRDSIKICISTFEREGLFLKNICFYISDNSTIIKPVKAFVESGLKICKERNLLVPKGYIQTHINKATITECNNIEMVSESYDFLFKGFEKYGYTLQIDTIYNLNEINIRNQVIGHFDLVNNTDSTLKIYSFGWSIENMGFVIETNRDSLLKPGDSIKIKYKILKGLYRISNSEFNSNLLKINNLDSITNKRIYIDRLNLNKKIKNSKAYFRIYNRLNISDKNFDVIFMIPIKYLKEIQLQ
jgi:hypothetical protein